jgi:hypothetical protein
MVAANFQSPFQISHGPLSQILGQSTYSIPDIQRPYAWEIQNAKDLMNDLQKIEQAQLAGRPGQEHYFGTIVVVTQAGQRDEIVDGQQRLTTASVLLGQIVRALTELADKAAQKAASNVNAGVMQAFLNIELTARNKITIVQQCLRIQNGIDANTQLPIWEPRIKVSPEISLIFKELVEGRDGTAISMTKKPERDLKIIADYLYREFVTGKRFSKLQEAQQLQHLDSRADEVLSGLVLVKLSTAYANAAAELFESLNARGKALNVLGLVKVWVIGTLRAVSASPQVIGQVSSDFRSVSDDDDEIAVRFFTDVYRIRALQDVKSKVTPKDLSLLVREHIFGDPFVASPNKATPATQMAQKIAAETVLLKQLWPTWNTLAFGSASVAKKNRSLSRLPSVCAATPNPAWVNSRLHLLLDKQWLSHLIVYPFLTAMADYYGTNGQAAQFEQLLHDTEKFFFRAKSVCNIDPKAIHALYFKQLEFLKYQRSPNLGLLKQEMNVLISRSANDALFSSELLDVCTYEESPNLTKYLLSMVETYAYSSPTPPGVAMAPQVSQNLLDLSKWQLEHIVPQNPQPGAHQLSANQVHRLGNLCLLPPDWNGHLSNADYQQKRQKVAQRIQNNHNLQVHDSHDVFTNLKYANSQWGPADVSARENKLLARALQIFVI